VRATITTSAPNSSKLALAFRLERQAADAVGRPVPEWANDKKSGKRDSLRAATREQVSTGLLSRYAVLRRNP